MYIKESKNEYGTPISVFKCDFCGQEFTVCPAIKPEDRKSWNGCGAPDCESYDPARDVSRYFVGGKCEVRKTKDGICLIPPGKQKMD